MKFAIIYSSSIGKISYYDDYLDSMKKYLPNCDLYDVHELSFFKSQTILFEYDYIIFSQTTNSNGFNLPKNYRLGGLRIRKAKLIFFIGNEYKLMHEKIRFLKLNKIEYLCTQLPVKVAHYIYNDIENIKTIAMPPALNLNVFNDKKYNRSIGVGSRWYQGPFYLGDIDKYILEDACDIFKKYKTNIDISTDENKRFNRSQWAEFLNKCKFTIASEAGSSYIERDDYTRKLVNKFVDTNPNVTFEEVYDKFFKNYKGEAISGKCISARHFEAIGTKTCQILLEGKYSDILKPNEHYIELKKDFSNIDEVIEKMKDDKIRKQIVDRAYDYVINNHTYKHRIEYLIKEII